MKLKIDEYPEEPFCLACGSTEITFCMKTLVYKCLDCGSTIDEIPDDSVERDRTKTRNKVKRMKKVDDPNEL
jgi:DNA-directed RNA polymerase subunit RPC12/RpoP